MGFIEVVLKLSTQANQKDGCCAQTPIPWLLKASGG